MSNRLPFAALAVACLAAAAAGGYIATRQNAIPTPASAQGQDPANRALTASATGTASAAVKETEATVSDSVRKPSASTTDAAKTTKKRVDTARSAQAAQTPASAPATPPLQGTWPSSAAQVPAQPIPAPQTTEPPVRAEEHAQETPRAPQPPQPTLEDLVIPRDSVIGLQTDTRVASDTARIEDRVEAKVTRDVSGMPRIGTAAVLPIPAPRIAFSSTSRA